MRGELYYGCKLFSLVPEKSKAASSGISNDTKVKLSHNKVTFCQGKMT